MAEAKYKEGRVQPIHSEKWIQAFNAKLDDPTFGESMLLYARSRTQMVSWARQVEDTLAYAEDLVNGIVCDTLAGVLTWDPDRVSLEKHFYDAIKSRSRHAYRRALKHSSIDRVSKSELERCLGVERIVEQPEASLQRQDLSRIKEEVVSAVRALAGPDFEVLLLLEAYEQQIVRPRDLRQFTQLSQPRLRAARKRLDRLVQKLPRELRDIEDW